MSSSLKKEEGYLDAFGGGAEFALGWKLLGEVRLDAHLQQQWRFLVLAEAGEVRLGQRGAALVRRRHRRGRAGHTRQAGEEPFLVHPADAVPRRGGVEAEQREEGGEQSERRVCHCC